MTGQARSGIAVTICLLVMWLLVPSNVRGAERQPERQWQIWSETDNEPYRPHIYTSITACTMDIAGAKDGSGKRLSCRKISRKE